MHRQGPRNGFYLGVARSNTDFGTVNFQKRPLCIGRRLQRPLRHRGTHAPSPNFRSRDFFKNFDFLLCLLLLEIVYQCPLHAENTWSDRDRGSYLIIHRSRVVHFSPQDLWSWSWVIMANHNASDRKMMVDHSYCKNTPKNLPFCLFFLNSFGCQLGIHEWSQIIFFQSL